MNCDQLAPWYRLLEYGALGRALERRREAFLGRVGGSRRALLLGDGDGRFAAALLARQREAQVVCVEQSAGMVRCARRRLAVMSPKTAVRARWVQAEVGDWLKEQQQTTSAATEGETFDLVAAHFFFDCFSEPELATLIAGIATLLKPEARWVVSEFRQPPGRGWRAWHAWIWLRVLYLFFRVTTGLRVNRLPNHRTLLEANGFELEAKEVARAGLLTSELWRRRR